MILRVFIFLIAIFQFSFADKQHNISLQLKWKYQFQFAGFIMAKEKGFYNQVDINLDIKEAHDNQDTTNEVLSGKSEFGISDSRLIYDRMMGKDIVLLSAIFQESPYILLSLKEKNINKISDLVGKKLMLDANIKNSASILAMLEKYNMKDDVDLVPTSYNINDLIENKVDLFTSYISNEPNILRNKGIEYNYIKPSDYGFNFYGDILFTSQNYLKENPKIVKDFYTASMKGWKYAFENIEETINIILNKYDTLNHGFEHYLYEAQKLKELSGIEDGKFGKLEKDRIDHIKSIYFLISDIHKEIEYDYDKLVYKHTEDKVKVCYAQNLKPYVYDENNIPKGIAIDFMNLIAKNSDIELEYVKAENFADYFNLNKLGYCDVVPLMIQKPNKYEFLIPTDSYSADHASLVTRNDEPYVENLNTLIGKKIGMNKDYRNVIELLRIKFPKIELTLMDYKTGLKKVANGEIYGYIDGYLLLSYALYNEYHAQLKIMRTLEGTKALMSIGVNKNKSYLVDIFNSGIAKLTTKDRNEINSSWKAISYNENKIDQELIYKIVGIVSIILIFFLYKQYLLTKMNKELSLKLQLQIDKIREKDRILFQQSKLASMGEMLNNIAHQWRQPLNEINSIVMSIDYKMIKKGIKDDDIEIDLVSIENQTNYMSRTIDNFKNYFKPDKNKTEVLLSEIVQSSISIVKSGFSKNNININLDIYKDKKVKAFKGEFIQVIITILNNSADAFEQNKINNPIIDIIVDDCVTITDNAGGINKDIIDKIFEPYFTTKQPDVGTGVGLYMAKMIINNLNGDIEVSNTNTGVSFKIRI